MLRPVRVWDLPIRIYGWLFPFFLCVSYFSAGLDGLGRAVHILSGYTLVGLLVFRVIWGFFGGEGARFSNMIQPFSAIKSQFHGLLTQQIERYPGHSPVGGWAVLVILLLAWTTVVTGLQALLGPEGAVTHAWVGQIVTFAAVCYATTLLIISRHTNENVWQSRFFGHKWIMSPEKIPHRGYADGLTTLLCLAATLIITTSIIGQTVLPAPSRIQTAAQTITFEEDRLLAGDFGLNGMDTATIPNITEISPAAGSETPPQ